MNYCSDVNYKHVCGDSTISAAAWNGYCKIVELLLSKGANIHIRNLNYSTTPLLEAATRGHVEIAEMLMTGGANVNDKNQMGETPLMMASSKEIVERLLSNGATTFVDE